MKKRLFVLLLCLVVCLTVLPVYAFAGDGLVAAEAAGTSPLTGDESNVALWIVIAVVALAAIAGIIIYLTKRKK